MVGAYENVSGRANKRIAVNARNRRIQKYIFLFVRIFMDENLSCSLFYSVTCVAGFFCFIFNENLFLFVSIMFTIEAHTISKHIERMHTNIIAFAMAFSVSTLISCFFPLLFGVRFVGRFFILCCMIISRIVGVYTVFHVLHKIDATPFS